MIYLTAALLLLIDFYIYKALRQTDIGWVKGRLFPRLWWGYSALILIGVLISIYTNIPLAIRSIILVAFFLTFTTKFLYMLILMVDDLRRGGVWIRRRLTKPQAQPVTVPAEGGQPQHTTTAISRSRFITQAGIIVAALPLAPLGWGIVSGAYNYRIHRQKLYLPNLPQAFHGMKIGQLSDIHSGSFYNKRAVLGGVEMLLQEKPDMVFFTGDLVNHLANEMREYQDIFNKVQAPLGVYSVLGNHDYGDYHFGFEPSEAKAQNFRDMIDTHRVMGWNLLMNENQRIRVGSDEIGIAGVENWGTGRFPRHGKLDEALQGLEEVPVKLLLSHDPSHWRAEILARPDVDVTFAGHTHGMQFGIRTEHFQWSPVQYIYPEWAGLYREKHQQVYVNTGFGFLGYPGRAGILPEITVFELIRGEKPA